MAIGRDAGAVSSVCVAADEVELTESLLSMSSSGSWDVIDGISCVINHTLLNRCSDFAVSGLYCTWVRTALDAGGADVFLTVTSCGIWPKVKGFWVCCVGVGRSLCWWSTC